ncbi:MAG: CPBP family glutamic-type intramembrane protease [Chitinispirillia bacterium]|jgi:membrane protease YdiL (CAAX protease family)
MLRSKKSILLFSSVLIMPVMSLLFLSLTRVLGPKTGYFTGFAVYWIYCIIIFILLINKRVGQFNHIYRIHLNTGKNILVSVLAFLPVFAVFYIQFLPVISSITTAVFILAMVNAILNGIVEELYWRGLYLVEYRNNIYIGLWLSVFLFGAWHISMYLIEDIYFGGFGPLVGGALLMGLLWSFISRTQNSIFMPTAAHILVNFFAFTGLYLENAF